jgi:molecular chaperone GrpE
VPHGDKQENSESKIHIAREPETESGASGPAASAADTPEAKGAGTAAAAKDLQSELDELRQTLIRRQADFDNYRKRVERERGDDSRRTTAYTLERFLPMLDALEHALAAHREPAYADYRKGFELIHKQFLDALTRLGVERMDPTGQPFDPHLHQAVDRIESTEHADGTVVEVLMPGYLYNGKALRPAAVRVAVRPQGQAPEEPSKANASASRTN